MKVLMVTPRVDIEHDIFGFIHTWVDELSKRVEHLDVIAFRIGKTKLRNNVNLYSAYSKYRPIKFLKLNKFLLKLVPKADLVFTHMYPWLPIVAAPYAKLFRKPLIMWNTHGYVDFKKKIALTMVDKVVTASERSFNITTPKKVILGHGIDTDKFRPSYGQNDLFKILCVGRIDKIKGYDILIKAMNIIINNTGKDTVHLTIVGPIYDKDYFFYLKKLVSKYHLEKYITFEGNISYMRLQEYYQGCDIVVHPSYASSLEKTILEAMACEKPVLTSNIAYYQDVFDDELREKCFFAPGDYKELADKIEYFMENEEKNLKKKLRDMVVNNHSINHFIERLVEVFEDTLR